jgi:hypothetical protein
MGFERELQPVRNLVYAFALLALCAAAILATPTNESPYMHTFFDSGMVVVSGVLTLLLWDIGWRTSDSLTRLLAVAIGVTAAFELFPHSHRTRVFERRHRSRETSEVAAAR